MISLLIDQGNTRIKWALSRSGALVEGAFGAVAGDAIDLTRPPWPAVSIDRIVLASVADDARAQALMQQLRADRSPPVVRVRTQSRWGDLINGYALPDDLGVDRWLGLIAARTGWHGRPLLVVSAGTALTVDALAADGRHLGGVIAPGLAAMRQGLLDAAPGLKRHAGGRESDDWALASDEAIASGCLQAALGLVERARSRLSSPADALLLMTGGDAPRLLPALVGAVEHRPRLVLEGLAICADDTRLGEPDQLSPSP